jgi:predicted site-specific integrase-resolvase
MASEFAGQTCGIYPRVSSLKQGKGDKTSLDDQIQACRDYAADLGMRVDDDCIARERYTSTQMSRPELNLLLTKMKARHVPNLIIDTADRLTRQGQLAASVFLLSFKHAGITLHVVEDDLVVQTDKDVKDLLDRAYDAQQNNLQRVRKSTRAKRSRARAGHYIRGNRAPYGYRYEACAWDAEGNVTDRKHVPDERPYASLGWPTTFAPMPYAARKEMLRLYAVEGLSLKQLATRLNTSGVPTSSVLLKRQRTSGQWYAKTVRDILEDPLNEGILTNFRTYRELAEPDDRHDDDWHRVRAAAEPIVVVPAHGAPAPLLDERMAAIIARRRVTNRATTLARSSTYAGRALLAGGLAVCGVCRAGTLVVHGVTYHGRPYLYYRCHRHDLLPLACPGMSLPVRNTDLIAWDEVFHALARMDQRPDSDNYMDVLARAEADRYATGTNGSTATMLEDLKAARDAFMREAANLTIRVGREDSDYMVRLAKDRIQQLEPEIAEANRKIAALERKAERKAAEQALLSDYLEQYHQHVSLLASLTPYAPEDIPIMATILRAVGAQLIIPPRHTWHMTADGPEYGIEVELTIGPEAALPWFTPERAQQIIDERRNRVIDYGIPGYPPKGDPEAVARLFTTPLPSPARTWSRRLGRD